MTEVTVVTEALRAEAAKWDDLCGAAAAVGQAADRLVLEPAAFFIGDHNMVPHSLAYDAFQSFMVTVLGGAATEFEELGVVLRRIADGYDEADAVVALDLDEIYRLRGGTGASGTPHGRVQRGLTRKVEEKRR